MLAAATGTHSGSHKAVRNCHGAQTDAPMPEYQNQRTSIRPVPASTALLRSLPWQFPWQHPEERYAGSRHRACAMGSEPRHGIKACTTEWVQAKITTSAEHTLDSWKLPGTRKVDHLGAAWHSQAWMLVWPDGIMWVPWPLRHCRQVL